MHLAGDWKSVGTAVRGGEEDEEKFLLNLMEENKKSRTLHFQTAAFVAVSGRP